MTNQQLLDLINWKTVIEQPRYAGGHEEVCEDNKIISLIVRVICYPVFIIMFLLGALMSIIGKEICRYYDDC